jgi:predicted glycosyltransferase involved in capsule biosynthesis
MNITFGTSCMGRTHHLRQIYVNNIETALAFSPDIKFTLLNWNSQDGMDQWVSSALAEYIDSGTVKYIRNKSPTSFSQSKTKNITMRSNNSKIVCNLDADNVLTRKFLVELTHQFDNHNNPIVRGVVCMNGCTGRIACRRESLIELGGFNEEMIGWGYEDTDFVKRFELHFNTKCLFWDKSNLHSIDADETTEWTKKQKSSHNLNMEISERNIARGQYIYLEKYSEELPIGL